MHETVLKYSMTITYVTCCKYFTVDFVYYVLLFNIPVNNKGNVETVS